MSVLRILAVVLMFAAPAFAEPIAEIRKDGIVITLTDEPCALNEFVTNLPYRTTWTENGKVIEGCAGPMFGAIVAWYEDKTVALFPIAGFTKVRGT